MKPKDVPAGFVEIAVEVFEDQTHEHCGEEEGCPGNTRPYHEALVRESLAEILPLHEKHLQDERDTLKAAILDIDAHATPYGDIPDEPGYVGTYLVTAGSLHRALGKIGHTAPKCQAEAERDALKAAISDAICRMATLRAWAHRELTGDTLHNVLAVMTNVWDILDPDRSIHPALAAPETPGDAERIADERPTGVHAFEQNPAATQVSVCICGKWRDHHVHGADPCGCDACRTSGDAEEATDE
jgi:hypothetical protein